MYHCSFFAFFAAPVLKAHILHLDLYASTLCPVRGVGVVARDGSFDPVLAELHLGFVFLLLLLVLSELFLRLQSSEDRLLDSDHEFFPLIPL